MKHFFADLHIHIGSSVQAPVKISASKDLTFIRILEESYHHKGLDMIGIIDAHSPYVQSEISDYMKAGMIKEHDEGGLLYKDLVVILGTEIEIKEKNRGSAHYLVFFPFFHDMVHFTSWMKKYMKNVFLSSQRLYVSTRELQHEVKERNGLFVPAHIFTPHKSVYGKCCDKMEEVLDLNLIDAVELGLSANTMMADRLKELNRFPFLTNSDAHSLPKIGREYNKLWMRYSSFQELRLALKNEDNRKIVENFGLDPLLGKYHKSRCIVCNQLITDLICDFCGSTKIVKGVSNRIDEIANFKNPQHPNGRPSYIHQVPLEFMPKLGPKTLEKLLSYFGTEMNILHQVSKKELEKVVSKELAEIIIAGRNGELEIQKGGGGVYGKVLK